MGLTIEWTKQAASGYSNILKYLDEKWTAKEVAKFEVEIKSFLEQLSEYPELLKGTSKNNLRSGPINKHTILTYRIKPNKKQIQLLHIRSSKQKPLR